jgi:signal transduction histidine kinase
MTETLPERPKAAWRQVPRDLAYLLPGLPIAIGSFVALITGFFLGIGLVPLALFGLVVLFVTLAIARGFAVAERARVGVMERRSVGPVHHRDLREAGLARFTSALRDPMTWREWGHGVLILPVRVFTWSIMLVWVAGSLNVTYPLWAWSLPQDDREGLADLVFGWDSFAADVLVNTGLSLVFLATLPYVLRAMAVIESSLAWSMLTNESAALRARAAELGRSREAVVQAEADTLRRVERDIHDGPQQRLVRLTMDLQTAKRRMSDDPDAAAPLIEGALDQTQEALDELRALSRGIAPPILTDRGLHAALAAAAARCPVPVKLDVQLEPSERLAPAVENAAYFVVTEALTNVAKHSEATSVKVSVLSVEGRLIVEVSDDGRGGAHLGKGHGLAGLADRLAGVDGELIVDSPPAGGTVIEAHIPVSS